MYGSSYLRPRESRQPSVCLSASAAGGKWTGTHVRVCFLGKEKEKRVGTPAVAMERKPDPSRRSVGHLYHGGMESHQERQREAPPEGLRGAWVLFFGDCVSRTELSENARARAATLRHSWAQYRLHIQVGSVSSHAVSMLCIHPPRRWTRKVRYLHLRMDAVRSASIRKQRKCPENIGIRTRLQLFNLTPFIFLIFVPPPPERHELRILFPFPPLPPLFL